MSHHQATINRVLHSTLLWGGAMGLASINALQQPPGYVLDHAQDFIPGAVERRLTESSRDIRGALR